MVNIVRNIVTGSARRVNSGTNTRKYITIHETANTSRGADASAHARLQASGNSRNASWHYQVDDKQIIQSYEHTDRCWHAGNTRGNNESIGIEICVNSDGDFSKALANAAALVAHIMKQEGIPLNRVVQHNHWSGKNCPTNLRRSGWSAFLNSVSSGAPVNVSPAPAPAPSGGGKSIEQMADEVIAGRHGSGHANRQRSLGVDNATYQRVRALVNQKLTGSPGPSAPAPAPAGKSISQMADEVIAGRHGSGHDNRRRSLGVDAATYEAVRAEVNRRAGVSTPAARPAGKSIEQMATEVLAGKHGNGHANRQRSLGIDNATYQQVRNRVNARS